MVYTVKAKTLTYFQRAMSLHSTDFDFWSVFDVFLEDTRFAFPPQTKVKFLRTATKACQKQQILVLKYLRALESAREDF